VDRWRPRESIPPERRKRWPVLAEASYHGGDKEGRNGMDKSAAKKEYKETKRPMGVYRIRNTRNNKSYVGFDRDWSARINRHKAELKFGSHRNRELQEEWNSFGESSFQFEVLDELDHKEDSQTSAIEELQVLAEMWIRKLEKAGDSVANLQPPAAPKTASP
jgi:hypothetical protein